MNDLGLPVPHLPLLSSGSWNDTDTNGRNLELPLHTDTAYFTDPCGLQLFHLLSHEPISDSEHSVSGQMDLGGYNTLCDGLAAETHLKRINPRAWKILKDTEISHHAAGNTDIFIQPAFKSRVFNFTADGLQIRWNNDDRSTRVWESTTAAEQWYRAAKAWYDIINDPKRVIKTKFVPGRAVIFDNWRMLHGRTAFTGNRRMCGGYISHDDFISKYRLTNWGRERCLSII